MADPEIEQLEADLATSRTQAWDVEQMLVKRHRAKIEALEKPDNRGVLLWEVAKGLALAACAVVGYMVIVSTAGMWLVLGEFPWTTINNL